MAFQAKLRNAVPPSGLEFPPRPTGDAHPLLPPLAPSFPPFTKQQTNNIYATRRRPLQAPASRTPKTIPKRVYAPHRAHCQPSTSVIYLISLHIISRTPTLQQPLLMTTKRCLFADLPDVPLFALFTTVRCSVVPSRVPCFGHRYPAIVQLGNNRTRSLA